MPDTAQPLTGHVQHLDVDGVRLAVRTWGEPDARPLLFWHPLGDITSGAYLTELAPALTARGFRLVAPDGPGFGSSPAVAADQYAVPRLAALVWGIVDALGLEQPVLMGHSWGGVVVLAAAGERPQDASALVLLDSGHFDYTDRPGSHPEWSLEARAAAIAEHQSPYADRAVLLRELADEVRRPVTDGYLAGLEPGLREQATGELEQVVTPLVRAAAQHGMLRERSLDRWPALAAAGLPVLLLLATEPAELGAANVEGGRAVRARHPRAQLESLPGCGHDLIADGGPAIAERVGDWLSRGSAGRSAG